MTYYLPFERFLNPYRPSPPDIDFDVPDNRREEIIQFITIVGDDIQQMIDRDENGGGMSETYCNLKVKQLLIKLDRILIAIGNLK